jgi:hypothetical protein
MPCSSEWSLSFGLPHQNHVHFSVLSHACHMSLPPHSPWLDLPNDIWGWAQVIKFLTVQLPPFSCHIIPLTFQIFFSEHTQLNNEQNIYNIISNSSFVVIVKCQRVVPWLRRLVAGLQPRRQGFTPGSVHDLRFGICGGRSGTGTVFLRVLRFFPVSNNIAPRLHTNMSSSGERTIGPLVAAVRRHSLTPSIKKATLPTCFCTWNLCNFNVCYFHIPSYNETGKLCKLSVRTTVRASALCFRCGVCLFVCLCSLMLRCFASGLYR